jgi:hypothetical protein
MSSVNSIHDLEGAFCFLREGKIMIEIPGKTVIEVAENPQVTPSGVSAPIVKVTDKTVFVAAVAEKLRLPLGETADNRETIIRNAVTRATVAAAAEGRGACFILPGLAFDAVDDETPPPSFDGPPHG